MAVAVLLLGVSFAAVESRATIFNYVVTLDGLQETPPNASPAFGFGTADIDNVLSTVTLNVSFTGLLGSQTAAHIHTGAPGVPGPVSIPLPVGSPIVGVFGLTPTQLSDMLAGNTYINIHSTVFPGGEIRGQIVVPEPTTVTLVLAGIAGLFVLKRKS